MSGRSDSFDRIPGRIPDLALPEGKPPVPALVITCVEGCLPAGSLESQLRMDGLIVARNPANLVPVPPSGAIATVVDEALALGAREVIVWGHVGCSMIQRMLAARTALDDLPLAVWFEHAEAVRLAVRGFPATEQFARAVELNVSQQLSHLRTYPTVAAALLAGRLRLRGWLLDPVGDRVLAADPQSGRFTRRVALDPTQNSLFRTERLRPVPPLTLPVRDARSRYLA